MAQHTSDESPRENYLPELLAEKDSLDSSFAHCTRLLSQEIERVKTGGSLPRSHQVSLVEKIEVPVKDFPGFNFVGRLLGPRGLTMKRMQTETNCKMTIMGRGSVRDATKEEELRNGGDPKYDHLKENLYVLIEAKGAQAIASARLAAGIAEVRKMLIPCEFDQIREEQLRELAVLNGMRTHGIEQHMGAQLPPAAEYGRSADYARSGGILLADGSGHGASGMNGGDPYHLAGPASRAHSHAPATTGDLYGELRGYAPPPSRGGYIAVHGGRGGMEQQGSSRGRGGSGGHGYHGHSRGGGHVTIASEEVYGGSRQRMASMPPRSPQHHIDYAQPNGAASPGDYEVDYVQSVQSAVPRSSGHSGAYNQYNSVQASRASASSAAAAAAAGAQEAAWHKAATVAAAASAPAPYAGSARYRPY